MFSEGGNASRLSTEEAALLPLLSPGPCTRPPPKGDSFLLLANFKPKSKGPGPSLESPRLQIIAHSFNLARQKI